VVGGPILLATRGSSDAISAALVAEAIAARLGRKLEIVSVVEGIYQYPLATEMQVTVPALDAVAVAERDADLKGPFAGSLRSGTRWNSSVRLGQPAAEICEAARETDATMIVVGASPHRRARRVVAGKRAAQILHRSESPVLSVVPWLKGLPSNVIAAIDFNSASIRAAELAASILDDGGSFTLVHVIPPNLIFPQTNSADQLLRDAILTELNKTADVLRKQSGRNLKFGTILLNGDPVDEVLRLAGRHGADLIAVGTRGGSFMQRTLVGSVATEIFHSALCSVLASPPPPAGFRARVDLALRGTATSDKPKEFAAILDEFTRRNSGRIVSVEEDDPELGAQVQVSGYRLQGIAFDRADKRVEIMLGAPGSRTTHLTRSIEDVKSIAVSASASGEEALQVVRGKSQTLIIADRE
jgi:nucleotide-binding universal stress UspA family protein